MTLSPSINFTFLPLLPLLFFIAAASTTATDDLIDQTCRESSEGDLNIDFTFCVASFRSTPASQGANLSRLGLISMTLVKTNMTNTRNLIKNLLKTKEVDANTKKGLKDCSELYSDSISTLNEAAKDYKSKRFNDANVKMSSVMDSSTTCEDGFQDVEVVSPLTTENKHAFQLCAIALSVINMQPN